MVTIFFCDDAFQEGIARSDYFTETGPVNLSFEPYFD